MAQVDRFSITMSPELGEDVRQAAAAKGVNISSWMSEAAADKLRNDLLGLALDLWEQENGPFTEEDHAEADRRFGTMEEWMSGT